MKRIFFKYFTVALAMLMLISVASFTGFNEAVIEVFAAEEFTEGYYKYSVTDGEATIENVDESISGEIIIPSTLGGYPVKSIDIFSFSYCKYLSSIVIPDIVTNIGNYAFSDCTSLVSVTLSDSITSIGYNAFYNCSSLVSITIPDSVISIGKYAFSNCTSLSVIKIPDSVANIGNSPFHNTAYYNNELNWDNGIFYIENHLIEAKEDYDGLCEIRKGTKTIAGDAFAGCKSLTAVSIPDSVMSIGDWAFTQCSALVSVTIPDSVKYLGEGTFCDCSSLVSVTLPNSIESIEDALFSRCESLASIDLPESITNIGDNAFLSCESLASIRIPESVLNIGSWAFGGCESLTTITIPENVSNIDVSSFNYCKCLKAINVAENNKYYSSQEGVLFNKNKTILVEYPEGSSRRDYVIPDTVTDINSFAFRSSESLESINIPNSVKTIGEYAFADCIALVSITIPESVTYVGDFTFCCTDDHLMDDDLIKDIMFLNPETTIGEGSFVETDAVIHGYEGSTAQAYAEKHNRKFVPIIEHSHDFSEVITKAATCTEEGLKTYSCKCEDSYTEAIPALGHNWSSEWTIDKEATYTEAGIKSKHCTRENCNAKNEETEIPKLKAEFTDSESAKIIKDLLVMAPGNTISQIISQAGKGAVIKDADGNAVSEDKLPGTGMLLVMPDGKTYPVVVLGDVEGDGKVSAADARLALRASVNLESYKENSPQYTASNVNAADKVTAADARLILRASLGLEKPIDWMK